jgi:hypothetical protein
LFFLPYMANYNRKSTRTKISQCHVFTARVVPVYTKLGNNTEFRTTLTKPGSVAFLYAVYPDATHLKLRTVLGAAEYNQTIEFGYAISPYGIIRQLKCACGRNARKLFFKDGHYACRFCQDLIYDLNCFRWGNRQFRIYRHRKIQEYKAKVKLISRRDIGYTRKAKVLLHKIETNKVR